MHALLLPPPLPCRYPYMALLCALLAGDNRSVDALTATLASLSVPSVLSTIEDFMWCKLTLVGGAAAQVWKGKRGQGSRVGGRCAEELVVWTRG